MSPSTYATREPIANDILSSANAKYKNRDYLGALTAYTAAIRVDPNNALAICCRGVAYYRLGDDRDAMTDYNRAITSGRLRQRHRSKIGNCILPTGLFAVSSSRLSECDC